MFIHCFPLLWVSLFCLCITGATRTPDAKELLYARQKTVLIAKAFSLQAVDLVHINYKGGYFIFIHFYTLNDKFDIVCILFGRIRNIEMLMGQNNSSNLKVGILFPIICYL